MENEDKSFTLDNGNGLVLVNDKDDVGAHLEPMLWDFIDTLLSAKKDVVITVQENK